ncbi:hypothetical protein BK140_23575 [Paenibacillus macerans]|nr:hypothetical protein BK140_23575 [Paenibacillus macerans]
MQLVLQSKREDARYLPSAKQSLAARMMQAAKASRKCGQPKPAALGEIGQDRAAQGADQIPRAAQGADQIPRATQCAGQITQSRAGR